MNDFSKEPFDSYRRRLDRDHERLRWELLASLPDAPAGASSVKDHVGARPPWRRAPLARRVSKIAAMLTIVATAAALLWMLPGRATAEVAFAEVLRQIREACSVRYKSTLRLGDLPPRTSEVIEQDPGYQRQTMPGGQLRLSDFSRGNISYVEPQFEWTLTLQYAVGAWEKSQESPLERLKKLPGEAGRFLREEELAGRTVSLFEVQGEDDLIKIWADSHTGLPVQITIVGEGRSGGGQPALGAELTLSDFVWGEQLDNSLFSPELPEEYDHYEIKLIDKSLPAEEQDLVEAFRVLTDLSDGAFPDSLFTESLKPILDKLGSPPSVQLDTGTGYALLAGTPVPARDGEAPPMVRFIRAEQKRVQVSRGIALLNRLTSAGRPWRYLGKGVQRGQETPVLRYQPEPSAPFRVIHGDLTTRPETTSLTP